MNEIIGKISKMVCEHVAGLISENFPPLSHRHRHLSAAASLNLIKSSSYQMHASQERREKSKINFQPAMDHLIDCRIFVMEDAGKAIRVWKNFLPRKIISAQLESDKKASTAQHSSQQKR